MGVKKYEHVRISDTFVNLTDDVIRTYENATGTIWKFEPEKREIPPAPTKPSKDEEIIHYIVDQEVADSLKASGRPLDDIAVISRQILGRGGIEISYLAWAKDPEIPVSLYDGAHKTNFRHE